MIQFLAGFPCFPFTLSLGFSAKKWSWSRLNRAVSMNDNENILKSAKNRVNSLYFMVNMR